MLNSNQPPFWLQVRSEYIIDNFDNMLAYLKAYNYAGTRDDNPDYTVTLDCMKQECVRIGEKILETPAYQQPVTDIDVRLIVRLLCATILASHKAGQTAHHAILCLIDLLLKTGVNFDSNAEAGLAHVIGCCLRGDKLVYPIISWSTAEKIDNKFDLLAIHLSQMTFHSVGDNQWHYIENGGVMVVPPSGIIQLAALNRETLDRGKTEPFITLPSLAEIVVPSKELKYYSDYTRLSKECDDLLHSMNSVRPTMQTAKKIYTRNEEALVVVKAKSGKKIVVSSINPDHVEVTGNLQVRSIDNRPKDQHVYDAIKVGDILRADYMGEDTIKFSLTDVLEDFYREMGRDNANKEFWAVYVGEYKTGFKFISADGLHYGVERSKLDELSDDELEVINERIAYREPIKLRAYREAPDVGGTRFFMYAEIVRPDIEVTLPDDRRFTYESAEQKLLSDFLADSRVLANETLATQATRDYVLVDGDRCIPLLTLMYRAAETGGGSCRQRLEIYTAMAMLARILDRTHEEQYVAWCRRAMNARVAFARNEPFKVPEIPVALEDVAGIRRNRDIIAVLASYKNPDDSSANDVVAHDSPERIQAIVNASNSLISILDNAELNNIKQVLTRALDVEDEYVSILDNHTFYGTESISLEFKSSVVFPPYNRRRYASSVADPDIQRWAILRAVCGFLNSRSGGDLLIGVRDSGYANGIDEDIKQLFALGKIIVADADHYRTYLQNMFDHALRVKGQSVSPEDITRPYIDYQLEENEEGLTIVRVKIKPYPCHIVEFLDKDRPDGLERSFVRLSGRTVPITPALESQINKYKSLAGRK